jgi:ferredoxin
MAQVLRLDPIRCDGYGICAVHLPDRITLDEWGYPVIEPGPMPERLLSRARRAADACPVLALSLRQVATAPATKDSPAGSSAVRTRA